jgi:AraC-like DNA-binding protein/quercetin dioxygenase-like cupin family protein
MRTAWGTLGEPDIKAGTARLMHVFEASGATLRHALYEAGAKVPPHSHDRPTLLYGVGGPCVETASNSHVIRRRLVYHPAGYEHSLEFVGATHVVTIEIDPVGLGVDSALLPEDSVPLIAPLYNDVWRALVRVAEASDSQAAKDAVENAARRALAFMLTPKPEWLMQAVDALHCHWKTIPSATALAARLSLSPQYICRAFKKSVGVTTQQYALLLRLDYARGLLWGTSMPISEVAAATGFADQSHLTRALSLYSEKTPGALRFMTRRSGWEELGEKEALGGEVELRPRGAR